MNSYASVEMLNGFTDLKLEQDSKQIIFASLYGLEYLNLCWSDLKLRIFDFRATFKHSTSRFSTVS